MNKHSPYIPRMKKRYKEQIVADLMKEFNFSTVMQVPKLQKIAVNRGVNGAIADRKLIDTSVEEISLITGQKAVPTYSKKDISNFKLRKGMPVGVRVTLRGTMMYEFLDRLISSALPRVRDFRGVSSTALDGNGNYTLGITEQIIFPEIDIDMVNKITGMDITFVTSTSDNKLAYALLKAFGIPFAM